MSNSDLGTEGAAALGAMGAGDNENTKPPETQIANTNLEAANIDPPRELGGADAEVWRGDSRYFQTGKKAGTLKPSAKAAKAGDFAGLKIDDLTATQTTNKEQAPDDKPAKPTKAQQKIVEGQIAASLLMRALDTVADWISGGELGKDWNKEQIAARLSYREQLNADWAAYLSTLDVPMHPALVCVVGSALYVTPALSTPHGQSRIARIKAWVIGKVVK